MSAKKYIYFFFLIVVSSSYAQQQPQYGQYMFNQFALNAASAGSRNLLQTSIHYRNQWDGMFPGAPKTVLLGVNSPIRSNQMALGFQLISDQVGPKSSFGMMGTYAYRVRFYKSSLSAGIRLGFFQYTFNFNQIDYKDTEPLWQGFSNYQKTLPAADAGLFYNTSDMYIGLSFNQLIGGNAYTYTDTAGSNITLSKVKPHLFLTGGKAFKLHNGLILNPSIVIKYVNGAPINVDVDCNVLIEERIWLGTIVRTGYGFGILAQVMVNKHFKVGFSRDRGVSWMGGFYAARSNEFLLQFDLPVKSTKSVSPKYL